MGRYIASFHVSKEISVQPYQTPSLSLGTVSTSLSIILNNILYATDADHQTKEIANITGVSKHSVTTHKPLLCYKYWGLEIT